MKNELEEQEDLDLKNLKEETSDEKFLKLEISDVENWNLWRVFDILCGTRKFKENEFKYFDASDLKRILKKLGVKNLP